MTLAALLWLAVVVSVMALLVSFSNSPGRAGAAPIHWPGSSLLPLDGQRPTLVMFAHPRCPCTRASLGELELLLARYQGRLSAHLVLFQAPGTAEDWAKTGLWRRACSIPGVTVHFDNGGVEARRFHSETSGQTLLYATDGRLLFQGGITSSRGHSGDNPGRSAIAALLEGRRSIPAQTPVFGCSLFEPEIQTAAAACKR